MQYHFPEETPLSVPRTGISTEEVSIDSLSGKLRGRLSENKNAALNDAIILCPGLGVGMEGDFVKAVEDRIVRPGLARWSLRFNFFGLAEDGFNKDIRGFTFSRAADDFSAGVRLLREKGADRVTAICSSTGSQAAILAACRIPRGTESFYTRNVRHDDIENAAVVDRIAPNRIIAQAAVVDCFKSVYETIPPSIINAWKKQGEFDFPVGGQSIKMGGDFLSDVEYWNWSYDLRRLKSHLTLFHGEEDKVVPLTTVRNAISKAHGDLRKLNVISGAGHNLAAEDDTFINSLVNEYIGGI